MGGFVKDQPDQDNLYVKIVDDIQQLAENIGSDSGYKVPRFVTLKSDKVNLRVGSSTNYPIKLTNIYNL